MSLKKLYQRVFNIEWDGDAGESEDLFLFLSCVGKLKLEYAARAFDIYMTDIGFMDRYTLGSRL